MKPIFHTHKTYWTDASFLRSAISSFAFLAASLVVNFFAGIYATEKASNPVTDIILDNIPVWNVAMIFIYGPLVMWIFISILCLHEPKRIPFILKSTALFVLVRSLFISLTHIGPFPDQIAIDYSSDVIKNFTFGGDLFFSAHTGIPFLMALIFGYDFLLFTVFTVTAVFFGIIVLLAHVHYSIDVLSAFFITYTIYHLARYFFPKDLDLFRRGLPALEEQK